MSLTSISFAIFMLLVLAGYYIIPLSRRWIWLLIASAYFYISYNAGLSVWLLVSILLIYFFGMWLDLCNQKYDSLIAEAEKAERKQLKKKAKREKGYIAFLCAAIQIGIWGAFKFTDLVLISINRFFNGDFEVLDIIAPLGISFYTFQAISYIIDIQRGRCEAQKNPFKLALWLGFFPQMIQGPICRYSETAQQLYDGHPFEWKNLQYGAQLMLWGYFKKLIIANYAEVIVNTIFFSAEGTYHGCEYIIGIVLYTIQLYGDFSGGIDIIMGCAQMLGIHLPPNFKRPYFSKSIEEYWRRWHITLGAWFRDYIFYPLSISKWATNLADHTRKWFGNKLGNMIPTYIALILVWLANGAWHGAGLRFFMFGLYHGILIIIGIQFGESSARFAEEKLHINRDTFSWKLFQMLRTFALVCFGRILIEANSVAGALHIYKSIFTEFNPWVFFDGSIFTYGLDGVQVFVLFAAVLVLLLVSILQERGIHIRDKIAEQNLVFRWIIYGAALFAIIIFGMYGAGYNASDFIYMGY